MKKIASFVMAGALMASCGAPQNEGFEISGSFADSLMNDNQVYLMAGDSVVDSTVVKGNAFAFAGKVDSVLVYEVGSKVMNMGEEKIHTLSTVLLVPGSQVKIAVGEEIEVTDNGVNQIVTDFKKNFIETNMKESAQYQKMQEEKASTDSLKLFVQGAQERMDNLWKSAVKDNSDNLAGAYIFSDFCRAIQDQAEFDSIYQNLKYADLFATIVYQKNFYATLAATAEGKMFVDFAGKSLEGDDVKLSDYVGKGKYVLVDFWASWCGPCRGEIPNILAVNKKYAGKDFMVVGVDVWDRDEAFKDAVKAEKINYAQIFTDGDTATKLYAIAGIPQIMLFAPDGTIVKRDLRGDAIEALVKECLKK